jgi:hypothetical protein
MASLTGQLVAETYKALLKTIDNDILTASEKQITDGLGGGSNVFIDSQGFLRANKYKVTNGLATQFLKADGSLDANTYLTGITSSQIITALGYTPVTNARTLTINGTTYDLSANRSWTVAGTAAIWGNITGTLSDQTDLQTALNAKFNNPTGTISQYIRGDGSLATFPTLPGGLPTGGTAGQILAKIDTTDYNAHWIDNFATQTKNEVKLGQTLAKGTPVYVSSANGTNIIVSAASNASEATSSKTLGLLETGGATNALVKCVTFGLLAGLDTSTAQAGDPVWLGVNGALIFGLANKPYAPAHLVYIGVVTRVQSNNGEIFVNVQNGFELKEIHDVSAQTPSNNDGLFYESSTGLWKNKSIATVLGYTPQAELNGTGFVKASGTTISYDNSTYLTTTDADSTYQRLSNLSSNLNPSTTRYPSINAVIAGLDLKLDLTGGTLTGSITATSFVKTGGTSVQYLKADGSVAEITGDIVSGAGSSGYVPKWTSAIVLGSSILYDNGTSMGIGSTNVNYHAYGRSLTGSGFASNSFGFEASSAATTNGSLIGGLSMIISGNDSTRRIGSAIQSYISGSTATNLGADLRFYAKPDNGVLAEIVRITSSLITFNKDLTAANITATSFVKSGGTSYQFLMADGSVSTLSSPVTGSGSAGYIPKWTTAANIGSSNIYDDGTSIGIAYSTPNKGGYGRTLTGAAFGSASFGFEAVGGTTTNGGLVGGLSFILSQNDSSRIVGSAIQSNLVGTTATNYGADLRFFAKADAGVIGEVVRMTSAGLRVYGTIVKDGGTGSQFLMADGSVTTGVANPVGGTGTAGYHAKWTGSGTIGNGIIYDNGSFIGISTTTDAGYRFDVNGSGRFTGKIYGNTGVQISGGTTYTSYTSDGLFGATATPNYISTTGNDGAYGGNRFLLGYQDNEAGLYSPAYGFPVKSTDGNGTQNRIVNALVIKDIDKNTLPFIVKNNGYIYSANSIVSDISMVSADYRFNGSGYITYNVDNVGTNTFIIRNFGTSVLSFSSSNAATFVNSISAGSWIKTSGNVFTGGNNTGIFLTGSTSDFSYGLNRETAGLTLYAGSTSSPHITLKSGGNTGFGLTNPQSQVHMNGVLTFTESGYETVRKHQIDHGHSDGSSINNNLRFLVSDGGGTTAERMRLNGAGNLLLGTTTDAGFRLDVNGSARIQGGLTGTSGSFSSDVSISGNLTLNTGADRFVQIGSSSNYYWRLKAAGDDFEIRMANSFAALKFYYPTGSASFINSVTVGGQLFVNSGTADTAFFKGSGEFDGSNRVYVTNNAYIYGRNNLVLTGRLDASNDGYSFGTNCRNALVFSVNEGGAQGATGTPYYSFQMQGVTKGMYVQSKYGNDNSINGFLFTSDNKLLIRTIVDNGYVLSVNGNANFTSLLTGQGGVKISGGSAYSGGYTGDGLWGATATPNYIGTSANGRFLLGYQDNANGLYSGAYGFEVKSTDGAGSTNRVVGALMMRDTDKGTLPFILYNNGTISTGGSVTATAFYESSDMRLKTLIDGSPQIAGIENLEAKLYEKDGKIELGYFAQDAEKLMPYSVTKNADGFLNLSYREVHTAKIARLEKEVAELKAKLNVA